MVWGIEFKSDIYLSREDYDENIELVQDEINNLEKSIQYIQKQINMFASSNPKDIIPKDWKEEPIRWINNEIDELIEQLCEHNIHQYKLNLYKDYLKEHD